MFLLIRSAHLQVLPLAYSLHSNMFLLIQPEFSRMSRRPGNFTFQYVSINTVMNGITYERLENFTFQYVSINTKRLLGPSMD